MENKEMNMNELEMNEMEEAAGGRGGSRHMLPDKRNCVVYQIHRGDTLSFLAQDNRTTVQKIMSLNPTIKNANDITAGYYIYLPIV